MRFDTNDAPGARRLSIATPAVNWIALPCGTAPSVVMECTTKFMMRRIWCPVPVSTYGGAEAMDYFLGAENVLSPADATAAIIALPGRRYLMQLRDQKPNIFYPGHWGVFGGAIDPGETRGEGLQRELQEELSLSDIGFEPFTRITIDFSYCGLGDIVRHYFSAEIEDSMLARLRLGEGQEMKVFGASELLSMQRVVPYDAFAIWMHATKDVVRFNRPLP